MKKTPWMVATLATALLGSQAAAQTIGNENARTAATGSAAGAGSHNANTQLERCPAALGTIALVEDSTQPWFMQMQSHRLQSTLPVLRMLVQQSGCFVVVERGAAMRNMAQERALQQSGELRQGSNFGRGQMVSADYTMNPTITFSQQGTGGLGAALGRFAGGLAGALAGSVQFSDASTMLTLVDNRSGVQLAAAEGSSRNTDFNLFGGLFGGLGGGGAGGFTNTPEGKLIVAAFIDSYNQMVVALRNYQAQEVRGGLGTGGRLGVSGGNTAASREVTNAGDPANNAAPAGGVTSNELMPPTRRSQRRAEQQP
jgi:curli biogenesis system outer membrane secretion channel CsgG